MKGIIYVTYIINVKFIELLILSPIWESSPITRGMRPMKDCELSWSSQAWELCSNGIFPCHVDC